jgi:hypothetical protein
MSRSCDGRADAILGSARGIHSLLETCRDHRSPACASNSPNSISAMIIALGEKHLRTIWKSQCYRSIDQTLVTASNRRHRQRKMLSIDFAW